MPSPRASVDCNNKSDSSAAAEDGEEKHPCVEEWGVRTVARLRQSESRHTVGRIHHGVMLAPPAPWHCPSQPKQEN